MNGTDFSKARLLSEDDWAGYVVKTWQLQAEDGGIVAVTHVASANAIAKAPIVFLAGMFSNRHFWMSAKGVGLAAYLAKQGHDCWLVERRGIGQSSKSADSRAGLEETIRYDLPAVQQLVVEQSHKPAFWIGHSFGGVAIGFAVANYLLPQQVAGMVLFASQFEVGKPSLRWPGRLFVQGMSRLVGYFPARRLGLGPENEAVAAIDDACRWTTQGQKDKVLQNQLAAIHCPVLAVVGGADKVDPPAGCEKLIAYMSSEDKSYSRADRSTGYKEDYNHPGIVVSKTAADEIWPFVAGWLNQRCE